MFDPFTDTSSLVREYVWMGGTNIAVIQGGHAFYVRSDHIGRPVMATDASDGSVLWSVSYLPFGKLRADEEFTLRFPGQWRQDENGLFQNWMRDYDPTTGRYMQADPLGLIDGASVYGYALQNPGRYVDPKGEYVWIRWFFRFLGGGAKIESGPSGPISRGPTMPPMPLPQMPGVPSVPTDDTKGPDAVDDTVSEGGMCPLPKDDCVEKFVQCQESSLANRIGNHRGESRCGTCFNVCLSTGSWPDRIPMATGGRRGGKCYARDFPG